MLSDSETTWWFFAETFILEADKVLRYRFPKYFGTGIMTRIMSFSAKKDSVSGCLFKATRNARISGLKTGGR